MIPFKNILTVTPKRGVADAVDTVRVKHVSGGVSSVAYKAYDQGRKKFQGTAKHGVWVDEEPPANVYDECLLRLMTTDGLMLCTFTPLKGLSEIALRYLPHLASAPEPAAEKLGLVPDEPLGRSPLYNRRNARRHRSLPTTTPRQSSGWSSLPLPL